MRFNGTLTSAICPPAFLKKLILGVCVRVFLLVALFATVTRPLECRAQNAGQREYEIKAAYLYNFINYIGWAAGALPPEGGNITIGIVGECPYAAAFAPLNGKQIKGRKLVVKPVASTNDLEQCQIVFICGSEKSRLSEYLGQLKDAKLLTVSEIDGFAEQGGVINFISERNKVRFEINPEAARRAGLTISSELLKLAKLVKP